MRTYTLSRTVIDTEIHKDCCGDTTETDGSIFLVIKCDNIPIRFISVKDIKSSEDLKGDYIGIFTIEEVLDVLCKKKNFIEYEVEG